MRLTVVSFGKLKTPGMRPAAEHYLKGLRVWTPVEEIELRTMPVSEKSPEMRRQVQQREAGMLLDVVSRRKGHLLLLDEGGRMMTSRQWADMIQGMQQSAVQDAVFAVGGSLGFAESVRKQARDVLALSPQTLPHELARVVLLEQLFRAWSIIKNHPYHNEG